jgi:hypothetical protein
MWMAKGHLLIWAERCGWVGGSREPLTTKGQAQSRGSLGGKRRRETRRRTRAAKARRAPSSFRELPSLLQSRLCTASAFPAGNVLLFDLSTSVWSAHATGLGIRHAKSFDYYTSARQAWYDSSWLCSRLDSDLCISETSWL